jgi:hypothetical protein
MTKSKEEIVEAGYAHFLGSGAPYATARALDQAFLDRYRPHVPGSLLKLWQTLGLGTSHNGLVQFCDPEDHAGTLEDIFGADPEFRARESFVYAYSAFGRLFVWNTRWQTISINLPAQRVIPFEVAAPPPEADRDLRLVSALASISLATCDLRDSRNKPLFERAVKKLGPLAFGEVYGFVPALALGGEADLAKLHKVKAPEHFSILAQAGPFALVDASRYPAEPVRPIG